MDVVPDLFALVAKNLVKTPLDIALDQVAQETVQFNTAVVWATSSSKTASEIPADNFVEMLDSCVWTDRNKAGQRRNPHTLHRPEQGMIAAIGALRIGAADIESFKRVKTKILDPRRFSLQPQTVPAREAGIEPEIVMHHDHPIGGQHDIQFRAVAAKRRRMLEGRKGIFRPKARSAPVGDVPDGHARYASHRIAAAPDGA